MRVQGDRLVFDRLVDFPGGAKKFTIRYHAKTKRYWTLANPAPNSKSPASVRNTLALLSSADLREWRTERIVLTHPDAAKHGFQYADWQFDGKDLAAVVRTAFDDDTGGAHNFHDANFLIFLRVEGFRNTPGGSP
ncbi:MAG: hypothetical protein M1541_12810 [Acidobacteria bacterium]|nr:hypothetical protein [Acidobacteriota bacterium]